VTVRPAGRARSRPRVRLGSALFPGDRRVWWIAAGATLLTLAVVIVWLATTHETYAGTNSVAVRSVAADVAAGEQLCVPGVDVPERTAAVRFGAFWTGSSRPELELRVRAGSATRIGRLAGGTEVSPVTGARPDVPIRPLTRAGRGSVCLTPRGGAIRLGGMLDLPGDQRAPTVDGRPLDARIALWFIPSAGEERSLLTLVPELLERAALFRPDPIGEWTYVLLILLVWPVVAYSVARLMATRLAGVSGGARTALLVAAIGFTVAASWALVTPPFDAPDEPEHFAYAQSFAETGKAPEGSPGRRPAYSSRAVAALDAMRIYSHVEAPDGRPPWDAGAERRWQARMERSPGRQDDGGGYLTSTSTHSPAYYALTVPAYELADDPFSQLLLMRLVSALLGASAAACAFLTVRELLPRHEWAALAAGLVVALQPMFAFISGSLNNDAGVNAAAALLVFLLVRGLRRGLSIPLALAIGAVLAVMPLLKGTGYAVYPAAAIGIAGMLWRRHRRSDVAPYASLAGCFGAVYLIWSTIADSFGRTTFTTPGGASPAGSGGIGDKVLIHFTGYLSYVWQVFLPKLWFMYDLHLTDWPARQIYIERGWAAFGWYAFTFPGWVYTVIAVAVIAALVLCAVTLLRERRPALARGWEIAVLATALAGVVAGVEAAYFSTTPVAILPEQGRYAFTAVVPLAAVAVGACFAFGRRRAPVVAALLLAALTGFSLCAQVLGFTSFYS
jgi:hypothetical protein